MGNKLKLEDGKVKMVNDNAKEQPQQAPQQAPQRRDEIIEDYDTDYPDNVYNQPIPQQYQHYQKPLGPMPQMQQAPQMPQMQQAPQMQQPQQPISIEIILIDGRALEVNIAPESFNEFMGQLREAIDSQTSILIGSKIINGRNILEVSM